MFIVWNVCGAIKIAEVVAEASSWELVHDGEGDADASMPKGQHTLQRFFRFLFQINPVRDSVVQVAIVNSEKPYMK